MAKSKLTACLAAGALALGASLPALADGGEFVFVVDRAGITGDRSAQEIYAELVVTAGEYCVQFGDAQQTCVAEMVQLAIDEVAYESLTAIHARVTAHQDGVMTASYSD